MRAVGKCSTLSSTLRATSMRSTISGTCVWTQSQIGSLSAASRRCGPFSGTQRAGVPIGRFMACETRRCAPASTACRTVSVRAAVTMISAIFEIGIRSRTSPHVRSPAFSSPECSFSARNSRVAGSRAISTTYSVRVARASRTLGSSGSPRTSFTGRRRKSTMAWFTPLAIAS